VISPPRVELYTAPFCVDCDRARTLLERQGIVFEEIDLSSDLERCCALEALTGGRSAPQVVFDGAPVGGFDALARLARDDRLREWPRAKSSGPEQNGAWQ
jgi:glutaredoxin 3